MLGLAATLDRSVRRLAALGVLALASCQKSTAPDTLAVSLVLSKDVVAASNPVSITITATNVGEQPLTINVSCKGTFRVVTLAGEVVTAPQFCSEFAINITRELAPGEQILYEYPWDATGINGRLALGEYRVLGEVDHRRSIAVRIIVQ